ncbi:methylamine dehydrogenase accessory protein MauD [Novosphingobium jiangmenense]|uniref:Methylamine utilization protein MauD n=1 Tax=Novosphingobium jiangmenense TaxID=2791981 RepID=A0ABS0HC76_9SPHN|nr:methylamine dehydrogenase accessory protein MauD [Novosphingobium jiangmenense]MBF9149600.1 methylamine dehydrogenase accessory protein MauD [Novosphingobium jiangmenense]
MTNAVVAALIALWVLVIGLCLIVFALLRQVGMLHERLGPVGALVMPGGPSVGDAAPTFELAAVDGRPVRLGGPSTQPLTLLFFLSPTCPVCKAMLPLIRSIEREQRGALRVVLASDGDLPAQLAMIKRERLEAYPLVLSTPLGLAYQVSKLPHAVLIDNAGTIVAKGLINNREHLESLFEAHRMGVGSLQDLAARGLQEAAE